MRSVSLTRQRGDVAQPAWAVGEQRRHRQRHRRIGDVVAVEVEGLQVCRPPAGGGLDPVVAHPGDARAELLERLGEAHVALDAGAARPRPAPARRRSRRRRGSRTPTRHRPRRTPCRAAVAWPPGTKRSQPCRLTCTPKRHQLEGDADVGLGDEFAHHLDVVSTPVSGSAISSAVRELAGDVAAPHHAAGTDGRRFRGAAAG